MSADQSRGVARYVLADVTRTEPRWFRWILWAGCLGYGFHGVTVLVGWLS